MIIYNNKTGVIIPNVHINETSNGTPCYVSTLFNNYDICEHTEIKVGDFIALGCGVKSILGTVTHVSDKIVINNNRTIRNFNIWNKSVDEVRLTDELTEPNESIFTDVVDAEVPPPVWAGKPLKFDQLQTLWKSGDSQIHKNIRLINFLRLVDGDLSHVGDALLNGDDVSINDEGWTCLSFDSDVNLYTIKKKQVTLTLDADLVDDLMERAFVHPKIVKLQTQIKDQLV